MNVPIALSWSTSSTYILSVACFSSEHSGFRGGFVDWCGIGDLAPIFHEEVDVQTSQPRAVDRERWGEANHRGARAVTGTFVEGLARRMASSMPHSIDIGDLIQDGVLGLIDAAQRFDETRGIKFETFAERRVAVR